MLNNLVESGFTPEALGVACSHVFAGIENVELTESQGILATKFINAVARCWIERESLDVDDMDDDISAAEFRFSNAWEFAKIDPLEFDKWQESVRETSGCNDGFFAGWNMAGYLPETDLEWVPTLEEAIEYLLSMVRQFRASDEEFMTLRESWRTWEPVESGLMEFENLEEESAATNLTFYSGGDGNLVFHIQAGRRPTDHELGYN